MERKTFLRGIGMVGAASLIPFGKVLAARGDGQKPSACTLIPSETEGPFPLDLNENTTFFRQDIRGDREGVPLQLKMRIIGEDSCAPMPNVRVNVWHCDKDGIYSGYDNAMNPGSTSTNWLRGYQMTDANGEVSFMTIFPGWYSGRICHIHFRVFVSSVYAAVSQLSFDVAAKNALYAAYPSLYTKGADPTAFNNDNIFSDGYALQLATLTPNSTINGYDASLEVTVKGGGSTTGLAGLEPETGGQFRLGQNYPNPYRDHTTIPFSLAQAADARIDLFDLSGRKVKEILMNSLGAGDHEAGIDLSSLQIAPGNYIYQLQVENKNGIFRQCKMMTAAK